MRLAHAPIAVQLLILAAATARLTLLVIDDRITRDIRWWVLRRLPEDGQLAYLLSCPWCCSAYIGTALGLAWLAWPGQVLVFSLPWALMMVGGWVTAAVADPEPPPPK